MGGRKKHQAVTFAVRRPAHDGLIDATLQKSPRGDSHRLKGRSAGGIDHQIRAVELKRFLNNFSCPEGDKIDFFIDSSARMDTANRRGHLLRNAMNIGMQQRLSRLHFFKQSHRLLDAGGVNVVADLRAATGMADVHAGPSIFWHGKWVHAGITAGLRCHLQKDVMGNIVTVEHVGSEWAGAAVYGSLGHDGPELGVRLSHLPLGTWLEVKISREP